MLHFLQIFSTFLRKTYKYNTKTRVSKAHFCLQLFLFYDYSVQIRVELKKKKIMGLATADNLKWSQKAQPFTVYPFNLGFL